MAFPHPYSIETRQIFEQKREGHSAEQDEQYFS